MAVSNHRWSMQIYGRINVLYFKSGKKLVKTIYRYIYLCNAIKTESNFAISGRIMQLSPHKLILLRDIPHENEISRALVKHAEEMDDVWVLNSGQNVDLTGQELLDEIDGSFLGINDFARQVQCVGAFAFFALVNLQVNSKQ